jgi:hypothetical protein
LEFVRPKEEADIGNSVFFTPNDEPASLDKFKGNLDDSIVVQNYNKGLADHLPQIDELSLEEEDEELHCVDFGELGLDDDGISKKNTSANLSPNRSLMTGYSDSGIFDEDYINIGSITEDHIEKKDAKRYFKQRWWLINPENWPKKFWDNFVAIIIVEIYSSRFMS